MLSSHTKGTSKISREKSVGWWYQGEDLQAEQKKKQKPRCHTVRYPGDCRTRGHSDFGKINKIGQFGLLKWHLHR